MEEILEILEENSRYSDEQIAVMAGKTVEEVREAIRDYEEKSIIAGYTTLINWENTGKETVTALIEVKITPQCLPGCVWNATPRSLSPLERNIGFWTQA